MTSCRAALWFRRLMLLTLLCPWREALAQKSDSIPSIPKLDSLEAQIADTMKTESLRDSRGKVFIPDTVFLKNGDRLTGKILSFEQGRLRLDAQGPGIISIKWHKIVTVSGGNTIFKVEDLN